MKKKEENYRNLHIHTKEYILNELKKIYDKLTINTKELADVLNLSRKTISNKISNGEIQIKYIKLGSSPQAPIRFPIIAVAEYLTEEIRKVEPFIESHNSYNEKIILPEIKALPKKKSFSKIKRNKLWLKQN